MVVFKASLQNLVEMLYWNETAHKMLLENVFSIEYLDLIIKMSFEAGV